MKIFMRCIGGLLDGTYEFDDSELPDATAAQQAWSLYMLTEGTVGKGTIGPSPRTWDQAKAKGFDSVKGTGHKYIITACEQTDSAVKCEAEYKPGG